jgi:hypothetical protein
LLTISKIPSPTGGRCAARLGDDRGSIQGTSRKVSPGNPCLNTWKAQLKDRALAHLTHNAEVGVVHVGDPLGDGET